MKQRGGQKSDGESKSGGNGRFHWSGFLGNDGPREQANPSLRIALTPGENFQGRYCFERCSSSGQRCWLLRRA